LGEVVYDGPASGLTPEVLTQIYGEEDWSATIRKVEDDDEGEAETLGDTESAKSATHHKRPPPAAADLERRT
jgi:phosphonate transport system ATP-binding protein